MVDLRKIPLVGMNWYIYYDYNITYRFVVEPSLYQGFTEVSPTRWTVSLRKCSLENSLSIYRRNNRVSRETTQRQCCQTEMGLILPLHRSSSHDNVVVESSIQRPCCYNYNIRTFDHWKVQYRFVLFVLSYRFDSWFYWNLRHTTDDSDIEISFTNLSHRHNRQGTTKIFS